MSPGTDLDRYHQTMVVDLVALPHWHLRAFSPAIAHGTFVDGTWAGWFAPPDTKLVLVYVDGELVAGFWLGS